MTEGRHINAANTRRRRAAGLSAVMGRGQPSARLLAALSCAAAFSCNNPTPDLRPPPFGPDVAHPQRARLFFPTGLKEYPTTGHLLVVNGNFDHAFDGGTIVSFDPASDFQDYLVYYASGGVLPLPAAQIVPDIAPLIRGVAMIGNYGGPLEMYQDIVNSGSRVRAFTASRDGNALDSVQLDPATGALSCNGGGATDVDCRAGVFDTFRAACPSGLCPPGPATLSLEGPYGLAVGDAQLPGSNDKKNVLFVSALIPHVDAILNNTLFLRSQVAALSLDAQAPSLFYAANASSETVANGFGAGPLVFDKTRRRLILGGCYSRTASSNGSALSSFKCVSGANLLRFVSVDEGPDANVQVVDLAALIRSTETTGLALGGVDLNDPNRVPRRLYASVRNPDLLVEMDLPANPGQLITVLRATSLPVAPAGLAVIPRPPTGPGTPPPPDLIAIAAEATGNVAIYDTGSGQVVANLESLGKLPYSLAVLNYPQPADSKQGADPLGLDRRAHLAATVFDGCAIALIDVPYQRPWRSALRALLGSCP